jgi:hypothetical protein
MQNASSVQNNKSIQNVTGGQKENLQSVQSFLNTVDYKGEHCISCGHPWSEKGELHYKHCRFFVSSHLHIAKKH